MRSTFQRQLTLTVGMILLSFVVLGCSFTSLFYNYMLRQEKSSLSNTNRPLQRTRSCQLRFPKDDSCYNNYPE